MPETETKENNNDRVMHFLEGLALYVLAALLCQSVYEIAIRGAQVISRILSQLISKTIYGVLDSPKKQAKTI